MPKPLCKFCRAHHDTDEAHPDAAVHEALVELRRTEPGLGQMPGHELRATASPVTEKAVVTESPLPELPVLPKRGRPKKGGALSRAEIQRAYRERQP